MEREHFFDTARALGSYEGMLRRAVHIFKYHNKSMLAEPLGSLLSFYGERMLQPQEYDLILPVPLHPRRLRERGYNQSLMLARRLGRVWEVRVSAEALRKHRWTEPQTMLSADARRKNIKGAFSWAGQPPADKKILLVDDVYTSGSTANECARVLKKHGAGKVDVLTLARTH